MRASFDVEISVDRKPDRTNHCWSIAKSRDGDDTVTGFFEIEAIDLPAVGSQLAPTKWPVLVELFAPHTNHAQDTLDKALRGTQKTQRTAFDATARTVVSGPITFDEWIETVIKHPPTPGTRTLVIEAGSWRRNSEIGGF